MNPKCKQFMIDIGNITKVVPNTSFEEQMKQALVTVEKFSTSQYNLGYNDALNRVLHEMRESGNDNLDSWALWIEGQKL